MQSTSFKHFVALIGLLPSLVRAVPLGSEPWIERVPSPASSESVDGQFQASFILEDGTSMQYGGSFGSDSRGAGGYFGGVFVQGSHTLAQDSRTFDQEITFGNFMFMTPSPQCHISGTLDKAVSSVEFHITGNWTDPGVQDYLHPCGSNNGLTVTCDQPPAACVLE